MSFDRTLLPDPIGYFEGQGLRLTGRGKWRTTECRFHGGSDSMRINVTTGGWCCMNCGSIGDRAFYLEAWNGTGSCNIDRIKRGSMYIECVCLSVFGAIQPDRLERYLGRTAHSLDNDGALQRFQVMVYPDEVQWAWCDRAPVKGAREAVRDLFDRLATFDPEQDGAHPADEFVKLPYFYFDDPAQTLFIEWSMQLHRELIPAEQNPLMKQHLGKYDHIGQIGMESAIRAAAWCEYLAGHARRVYALVEAPR